MLIAEGSSLNARSRQDQRDVVGLLGRADPILHCGNYVVSNPVKWQAAVRLNGFNQAFFTKLAKFIFRFRDAITECYKDVSGIELRRTLTVFNMVEEPDHCPANVETPDGTILPKNQRRQMAGVGVGELMRMAVIEAKEECGIFLRLRGFV